MYYKIIYENFIGFDTEEVFLYDYVKLKYNNMNITVPLNKCKILKQIKIDDMLGNKVFEEDKILTIDNKKGTIKLINGDIFIKFDDEILLESLTEEDTFIIY